MSFWKLQRVPEPEAMNEADEVESYSSAAAQRHLDFIDNTFVEHLLRLLPPELSRGTDPLRSRSSAQAVILSPSAALRINSAKNLLLPSQGSAGWALDVGAGPGQIPIKILSRVPALRFVGMDRAPNMLRQARRSADEVGERGRDSEGSHNTVSERLFLIAGDGHSLPFSDATFSAVICNSVLHHAREPVRLLHEIFRVAKPGAAVLIRDLRRPARPWLRWHLWRHGRNYEGTMRRLFEASVRAAYTAEELQDFLSQVPANGARVFRFRAAHIGIERAASGSRI